MEPKKAWSLLLEAAEQAANNIVYETGEVDALSVSIRVFLFFLKRMEPSRADIEMAALVLGYSWEDLMVILCVYDDDCDEE